MCLLDLFLADRDDADFHAPVLGAAFLHAHDVPIVLMTDLEPSPLYAYAACALQCEASAEGYFPCYAGCLSILYALCSTLGSMRGTDAAEHARGDLDRQSGESHAGGGHERHVIRRTGGAGDACGGAGGITRTTAPAAGER